MKVKNRHCTLGSPRSDSLLTAAAGRYVLFLHGNTLSWKSSLKEVDWLMSRN